VAQTILRSENPAYHRAYQAARRNYGYRSMVDATVTVRMVRALRRIGYTNVLIAEGCGLSHPNIIGNLANETNSGPREKVFRDTADAVAAFYWRHHDKPRLDFHGRRTATFAAKRGWASPMAWDRIEDIHERPKGVLKA
jgi:hypothetical protein